MMKRTGLTIASNYYTNFKLLNYTLQITQLSSAKQKVMTSDLFYSIKLANTERALSYFVRM